MRFDGEGSTLADLSGLHEESMKRALFRLEGPFSKLRGHNHYPSNHTS